MSVRERMVLGFTPYQWLVIAAAWTGWGFDVFDALLFNYVSRLCLPSLLGGEASSQTIAHWTGAITSVLLIGWGIGGIGFGWVADRLGRTRTLLITMLTYALATAACALAPNIWVLLIFRFIASLGIGGEWAAGASLVAETVPDHKRVRAGAFLYTAAPAGLFLATWVTDLFTRQISFTMNNPELSWRLIFLTGLVPAVFAVLIRLKVREPESWNRKHAKQAKISALFSPALRSHTISGILLASAALLSWWSCNAFLPLIASLLALDVVPPPAAEALPALKAAFVTTATSYFNIGGLIGTLLTVPIATRAGRKPMFFIYFLLSAVSMWCVLRLNIAPEIRIRTMFITGLSVFGVFGSFTFYLPELFPGHLRGTGSGFCYNIGRFVTAAGPFIVGTFAQSAHSSKELLETVSWVAVIPLLAAIASASPLVTEPQRQPQAAGIAEPAES